ncbi:cytoplasmic protein [Cryptococcus neoformans Ze90-1]|nr:cytoplasmic protein [Cryptococcus neoformans var. grubii Ze90-1]
MSMHFAPQWAKPIKPSGSTTTTPTTEVPVRKSTTSSPFPALSANPSSASPTTTTHPTLSYSRVTHTPSSPNVATDGYFPDQDLNGGMVNPHPFRYSREQILSLFDESKFKERPIELVEMAEGGGVLVSQSVNRPVGMRDLTDTEKKILATSVHPALSTRRQLNQTNTSGEHATNGLPTRRNAGFTRGEGGAFSGSLGKMGSFGGGVLSPGGIDHKAPGALGGGFGGVAKRMSRRNEDFGGESRSSAATWRSGPKTPAGNFEGVLGFSNSAAPLSPSVETSEQKEVGQRKWRIAAGLPTGESDKTLDVPISNQAGASASVIATPSATPIPDRDATVLDSTPAPAPTSQTPHAPIQEPKEDLGAVEWFYRDPNGQEQGPFTGTQMHDWYSHSYFTDDLPLRRASENGFRPLSELKAATGNAVQPFLSPIRPRQLPPNLPIPIAALQQHAMSSLPDNFRNLSVQSPIGSDPRVSPQPPLPSVPGAVPYIPGYDTAFSHSYPLGHQPLDQVASPGYAPSPTQGWNALSPQPSLRMGMSPLSPAPFNNIAVPSPIGSAPLQYMQQQQQQQQQQPQQHQGYFGAPQQMGMRSASGDIYVQPQPWGMQGLQQQAGGFPQQMGYQPQPQSQPQSQSAPVQWDQPQVPQQVLPQQIQPQQQQEVEQRVPVSEPVNEESQSEQVEETAKVKIPAEPKSEADLQLETVEDVKEQVAINLEQEEEDEVEELTPVESPVISTPASKPTPAPTTSAWKKTQTPSGEASLADSVGPTPAQAASIKSSKPISREESIEIIPTPAQLPKVVDVSTPGPTADASASPSLERSSSKPKIAPWAIKNEERVAPSPSLRDIQEAEAKRAEARRVALAEARAATASPVLVSASSEDLPASMSWGLPSQTGKGTVRSHSPAAPTTPSSAVAAWGGAGEAPKKTLKQIQEEEEKRKTRAAQAARVAQGQAAGVGACAVPGAGSTRRGYADLAAAPVKKEETQPGWTTVGAGGRVASSSGVPRAATPVNVKPTPAPIVKPVATPVPVKKTTGPSASIADDGAPSVEFIRWTKRALTGFKGDVDDFISVLLSFPIDPPAASRADQMEIISDSVYANSSTLDGRRFAQEFMAKRKADAARPGGAAGGKKISSLADVVKTQPKQTSDAGFKVVKAKGKKKN